MTQDSDYKALWLAVIANHANAACGYFFKYTNDENDGVLGSIREQYDTLYKQFFEAPLRLEDADSDICDYYYRDAFIKNTLKADDDRNKRKKIKETLKNKHKKCKKCRFCVAENLFKFSNRPVDSDTHASRYWFETSRYDDICTMLEIADHHKNRLLDTIQEAITLEKDLLETFRYQAPIRMNLMIDKLKFYDNLVRDKKL